MLSYELYGKLESYQRRSAGNHDSEVHTPESHLPVDGTCEELGRHLSRSARRRCRALRVLMLDA